MRAVAKHRYSLGLVLTLLGGLVMSDAARTTGCGPSGCTGAISEAGGGSGGAELADPGPQFDIRGNTRRPISPGVMVPLNLRFTNPNDVGLFATDITVAVRRVTAPRATPAHPCTVRDFEVDQVGKNFRFPLAAGATTTLWRRGLHRPGWAHVGMINRKVNQDGCKGATLTLDYSASATWVHR